MGLAAKKLDFKRLQKMKIFDHILTNFAKLEKFREDSSQNVEIIQLYRT